MADEPIQPTKPKDPEIEKLEKELAKEELLAKIAVQKKTALDATLPAAVTPLAAQTTVDDKTLIEAYILSYQMLDKVADKIVNKIQPALGEAVLIHNAPDLTAVGVYRAFRGQMKELGAEYDAIAPIQTEAAIAVVAAAIVGVTAAAKSIIDLLALFRSQRDIKGVDVAMDDLPLISEVAGKLAAKQKKVYVPQLYPIDLDPAKSADLHKLLADVRTRAGEATGRVNQLPVSPQKEVAAARLKAADEIRMGYENLLTKVATSETPLLSTLLHGAAIEGLLGKAHVLYLKVLKASGTNETTKNIFKSDLEHSGGVIVNFVLFDKDGTVKLASTETAYSGETKNVPKD